MALRKMRNVWYVYFRDTDGRIVTRSLKTHDKDHAKTLHDEYMSRVRVAKGARVIARDFAEMMPPAPSALLVPVPEEGHRRGSIRIDKMWECALQKRPLSENHRKIWVKFCDRIGVKYADLVTPKLALDYLNIHYAGGNGKTYNNARSILNTVFRCCLIEAGLEASPFASIIPRRVTEVDSHRNLTDNEIERIKAAGTPLIRLMTMLSRWTAQRLETCARMTPAMLDFERKVIVVQPGKTKRFNKWVCAPIMPELEKFLRDENLIQPGDTSEEPLVKALGYTTNAAFSVSFSRFIEKLNITDTAEGKASFHSLRGSAITWFKEHGVVGEPLRRITGHESSAVEDIYARDIETVSRIANMSYSMSNPHFEAKK